MALAEDGAEHGQAAAADLDALGEEEAAAGRLCCWTRAGERLALSPKELAVLVLFSGAMLLAITYLSSAAPPGPT